MAFTVTSSTPSPNTTDVSESLGEILFTLSDDIKPDSVTPTSVTLGVYNTDPFETIEGIISLDDTNVLKFTPSTTLEAGTDYLVILTGGAYGLRSLSNLYLSDDYIFHFFTPEAAPGGGAPDDGIPLEEITESTISPATWYIQDGEITIVYTEDVPVGTTVSVVSKHPLGYPPTVADYWALNYTATIDGNTIILGDQGGHTLALSVADYLKKWNDGDVFLENSIPIVTGTVGATEVTEVTYDLAVNRQYTVTITIPDVGSHSISFLSRLGPFFRTIEESKIDLHDMVGIAFDNDEQLALMIFQQSRKAYRLWTAAGGAFPSVVPYYVSEYTKIGLLNRVIEVVIRGDGLGSQAESYVLGDFSVKLGSGGGTASKSSTLDVDLKDLQLLEYALGERVKDNDYSTRPLFEPAYALAAPRHNYGIIGLCPSTGRQGIESRPDDFERSLDYKHPREPRTSTRYIEGFSGTEEWFDSVN